MSLSSRIAAQKCAVVACDFPRVQGSLFCADGGHLSDSWFNRLMKLPDGTYTKRDRFPARDTTGHIRCPS